MWWKINFAVKIRPIYLFFCLLLFVSCLLTACWQDESTESKVLSQQAGGELKKINQRSNTLTISMFSPPAGMFNPLLYSDAYEANLLQFVFESLVRLNPKLEWEPALAREWHFENERKTLVFTLRDDVRWHDGTPFTAADVQYTYSVLAHPEYTGVRQSYVRDLVGFEAYQQGQEKEFAGVEVVDAYTVKFHFKEPNVAAVYRASSMIIPQHIYGKYPVKQLAKAQESLNFSKLVGTGPFKADKYVSNEAYTLTKYSQYWAGAPKVERLVWRVINQDVAPGLLANGELDIITSPGGVRAADYELVASLAHVELFETPSFGYQYLGFKLHYRPEADVLKKVTLPNNYIPNSKLQAKELRQAIAYALDRQGIVEGLLKGRGLVQHSPFSSVWPFAGEGKQYTYAPERAMRILEQAGFIDQNGDGYREQPNGDQLLLRLHYPTGDKVREQSALVVQRNLQDVGLAVRLHPPRDPGTHFAAVEQDQQNIDMFLGGWNLSAAEPDPKPIWDRHSLWNFPRWDDLHQQQLLEQAVGDPRAFDDSYRQQVYAQWAACVQEELPIIPLYSVHDIYAYHKRIKGVVESPLGIFYNIHQWEIIE